MVRGALDAAAPNIAACTWSSGPPWPTFSGPPTDRPRAILCLWITISLRNQAASTGRGVRVLRDQRLPNRLCDKLEDLCFFGCDVSTPAESCQTLRISRSMLRPMARFALRITPRSRRGPTRSCQPLVAGIMPRVWTLDLASPQPGGMPLVVKTDDASNPIDVRFLRSPAVLLRRIQARTESSRRGGFGGSTRRHQ